MTFLQLNYIAEIYNCGSINKAAQNLFVSQSSLSSSIRELEEEIGIQIFIRSNRGIRLTEDGQEFLTRIRPILEQQRKVERFYSDRNCEESVRLSISAQRYPFCAKAFVEFLRHQDVSGYEFSFKETDMDKVIEDVSGRKSDIGIIFLSDMTEKFMNRVLNSKELEFKEIKRVRPHVFLSKKHPLAGSEEISVRELTEYPYVVFAKKNNTSFNFSEEAVLSGPNEFKKIIYINDRATAYNIMAHSDAFSTGSGLLPEGYCPVELKSIPIKDDLDYMRFGWIKIKDLPMNPKAEEFIELLEKGIKGMA